MATTYGSYLRISELLDQQKPVSDEHDEMLFIVIHQVYELWFKQLLHEGEHLQSLFSSNDTPRALHTLKRILTILKTLVVQVDIIETMTPLNFLSFRDRLESASGFQSAQFREWEALLGARKPAALEQFPEGSPERERLNARWANPTLWASFLGFLADRGFEIPTSAREAAATGVSESAEVQQTLINVYRTDPQVSSVCERLVDLDEGVQEWRYRHVKMVERTIGRKMGTGGSAGAEYLRSTLFAPVFPDLWAIRAEL